MYRDNVELTEAQIEALSRSSSPTAEVLRAVRELSDKLDANQANAAKAERRHFITNCVLTIVFGLAGVVAAVFAVLAYFA